MFFASVLHTAVPIAMYLSLSCSIRTRKRTTGMSSSTWNRVSAKRQRACHRTAVVEPRTCPIPPASATARSQGASATIPPPARNPPGQTPMRMLRKPDPTVPSSLRKSRAKHATDAALRAPRTGPRHAGTFLWRTPPSATSAAEVTRPAKVHPEGCRGHGSERTSQPADAPTRAL